jgi:hypothetical protein
MNLLRQIIHSMTRQTQQPQYVKVLYFTDSETDYDRTRASKSKVQAFKTTLPEGNRIYTVELIEKVL